MRPFRHVGVKLRIRPYSEDRAKWPTAVEGRRDVACSAQDERRERDAVVRSGGDTRPHQAPVRCRLKRSTFEHRSPMRLSVARTMRQKRAMVRDLRSGVFELCLCAGVLVSLWWAIKHPEHVAACPGHVATNATIHHCISNTLSTIAWHWTSILGAGAIIGALVGAAVTSLIRMPRHI
jgi:hypothetical protein